MSDTASLITPLTAPLGGSTEGHLVVRRGLGDAAIGSDAGMPDIYTARCTRRPPRARVHGGTVELTYPRLSLGLGERRDTVTLNGSIPWRVEVHGGVGDVAADLSGVDLRSFEVAGGVAHTSLDLSAPSGTVPVRLGSVRDVTIWRPAGVPVRVRVRRGSRRLAVDDQAIGAAAGPTTLVTPGFATATDRLDVTVDAADRLTITTRG
jgi:hypothetical protein